MILACPFCNVRYLISASLFAQGPRQVRCARCSHSWRYELPKEIDVVAVPDAEPVSPPDSLPPIPEGSNLPVLPPQPRSRLQKWSRIGAMVVGVLFLMWVVFDRQNIAKDSPFLEHFYDTIGLHIYRVGEGLV